MTKAETILEQLGGKMFAVMTGAKSFCGFENTLRFKLPSRFAKDGINFVTIMLCADDTYYVEYGKLWGTKYRKMAERSGIYADNLRSHFTATTGLDCTL
jgi:hypothetical protein